MEDKIIAMAAPVSIQAASGEGETKKPARFDVKFYTGGALNIAYWDHPVVVDLAGLEQGNLLVANLDHDSSKRVGNFELENDGQQLVAKGTATAATPARDEVVNSAKEGYRWQASLEVIPSVVNFVKEGASTEVNGRKVKGPAYVAASGTLKGFAFVSHGADDNTSARIAAIAATRKGNKTMDPKFKEFIEATLPGTSIDALSDETIANLKDDFEGKDGERKKPEQKFDGDGECIKAMVAARKRERERVQMIGEIATQFCEDYPAQIESIGEMAQVAIDDHKTIQEFQLEFFKATLTDRSYFSVRSPIVTQEKKLTSRVLEAAICASGRLEDVEQEYTDQELQTAHEQFKHGIGLKEVLVAAAKEHGYSGSGFNVDVDVQRAAFGQVNSTPIHASSTLSLPTVLSNVANKFLRQGWDAVDGTPLRIAAIRSVRDFKTITTVSLTGNVQFRQVAPDGLIEHGTIGEQTYTNKADTYGIMFAITRQDLINDDLSALTAVPRRIGRGGMLKLNDIFWTAFLNNGTFFAAGNNNVSTGAGSALALAGLAAADVVFRNQTDPDGFPLGLMPEILLVPPTLYTTALELMRSTLVVTGSDIVRPDANVWAGRYRIETSPYMENSSYTGNSADAWYLLGNPSDMPVVEIVALNGRVQPVVETAEASFNTLGIEMRGYSDVGVAMQEPRGGVRSAGS